MKSAEKPIRFLLTGGGTGGHLFPAIAAAEQLRSRVPEAIVMFIGTKRKMDTTSLEHYGYMVKSIYSYGLKGKSVPELLKALFVLPFSFLQAAACILQFRPNVVLGVGGYVTGPVIAAARVLGKKTVIHEQNSIPGLANRQLGRLAERICISLPQSAGYFPSAKTVLTGNPVRKPILDLAEDSKGDLNVSEKRSLTILILGGSQGAHRLNELAAEALCGLNIPVSLRVIHQTGEKDQEMVTQRYKECQIEADVRPFFHDMVEVYSKADFLVSRAGATTLAELAVLGKPAILIPYPHAADNHQQKNGEYYVAGGGCRLLIERELDSQTLAREIEKFAGDEERRQEMAQAMKKLAIPDAAARIVDICMEGETTT
ncbi:MAG: undecaprenyldiphospho-muramoylpentapeptide beta-N-acetylglucosaminyltransferase [Desulfocapsaceae bacterium]|nr:undecaprenyldiphospho-muramoylpentapeptide beta-N-acetylglucosaminyltransferase [Desulfocapsaceae bacterium]